MKAIILAGGKGTRLEPYTTVFPKPLVPIGDRPILDIIIRQLAYYGFNDIVLTVGHLSELIQAYFRDGVKDLPMVKLSYVKENKPTGTAGSLLSVRDLHDTFLVMNGDLLTTMDYNKLVSYHREKGCMLTIGMHKKRVKIDFGVMETDGEGKLVSYTEKPERVYGVSMGIYVYEPEALKYIEPDNYLDFPHLVQRLLNKGEEIATYQCDDFWLDIGNHDDFAKAQTEFERLKDKFLPGYSMLEHERQADYVEDTSI